MQKIGMIGIGLMGHGIASNIQKAGYPLTVLDHPGNQPLDELLADGVQTCATPTELASRTDIIILCVTGSPQVEQAMLGDDGVLKGLKAGSIVVDCSTAIPESTRRIAAQVVQKGGSFLDAAMTRTPKEAAEGRLNLLVGGDVDVFERVRPLLSCFAEVITHTGTVGSGHQMKLLHNFVSLGTIALISEAATCAIKSGIDPSTFVDVIANGGGGGTALNRLRPFLLEADKSALRFSMSNAHKDMGYYGEMIKDQGCSGAISQAVAAIFADAAATAPERFVPELPDLLTES